MKNNKSIIGKLLPLTSLALGIFNTLRTNKTSEENRDRFNQITSIIKENNELSKNVLDKLSQINKDTPLEENNEEVNVFNNTIENVKQSIDIIKNKFETENKINPSDLDNIKDSFNNIHNYLEKFLENITKFGDNTNFIGDNSIIETINNFYSSLTLLQSFAGAYSY